MQLKKMQIKFKFCFFILFSSLIIANNYICAFSSENVDDIEPSVEVAAVNSNDSNNEDNARGDSDVSVAEVSLDKQSASLSGANTKSPEFLGKDLTIYV